MRFVSIRDIRNTPSAVWDALTNDDLVLTSNGDPVAVIVRVEKDGLEDTLAVLRRARAQHALTAIRANASRNGANRLTDPEIEAEIEAARRQARRA
jgi:antitoxin (DNA-binding transcriptional repressor) of toxin-antitoxin stability system